MASITLYKVEEYKKDYFKIFSGIYNDFRYRAASDYNFELEPLNYENFIKSIEGGLLKCLILFEDDIPTSFLVYTTLISEALELNIIHCIGTDNANAKRKLLIEDFLKRNKQLTKEKIVTYPLLGKQSSFANDITTFGFKVVNTSVMAFKLADVNAINKLREMQTTKAPYEYTITNWKTTYFKEAATILNESFRKSSDALFDSRFQSVKGCRDILEKITNNIYGDFLPGITKVLIYKKHIVGFCMANLTNNKIANIPVVAILPEHRNKGLGKLLVKNMIENLLTSAISKGWELKELNVSCDSDSLPAVKMYTAIGFKEEYSYPQAYLPKQF